MRVLIFVPCYNCGTQVGRLIGELEGCPDASKMDLIFVDNCSEDRTAEVIEERLRSSSLKNARLFVNEDNFGLGGSFKLAYLYAKEEK